jgi:cysteine desulfurase
VHSEGRAAKAIVEKARGQVAALVGCEPGEVVFTSGATEAAALAAAQFERVLCSDAEHDCVLAWRDEMLSEFECRLERDGRAAVSPFDDLQFDEESADLIAVTAANNETGVVQNILAMSQYSRNQEWLSVPKRRPHDPRELLTDAVQVIGKTDFSFARSRADYALASSHKLGGPKGIGTLIVREGIEIEPLLKGGGQELGRRSGTENVIGIAGFGAAAEAAQRDLESGVWDRIAKLRDDLEDALAAAAPDLQIFGKAAPRLPNTSCFAIPGWKGETQVMQMDLAGFAVSAGSACSSGKVGPSRVLLAMGFDEITAASTIRVSMGPTTTEAEVMGFADTWIEHYRRRKDRAA